MDADLIYYDFGSRVEAFSTMRDAQLPYTVVQPHQVHGIRIARVPQDGTTREELEGYDALITNERGCAIGVRTADCIPVLLYDPVNRAVAAVHSGWRGTVGKISCKTIDRMSEVFGTKASDLLAVIGPGICKGCFQVGEEVVEQFRANGRDIDRIACWDGPRHENSLIGGYHVDLVEENRLLLVESGVLPGNIQISGICTYEDARLYSARREGSACGRNINVIKLL